MALRKSTGPLGHNVKHLRELLKLPRSAVAAGIGIDDDQAIYALESRNSVRSEFAPALAVYFSVDLAILTTEDLTGLSIEEVRAKGMAKGGRKFALKSQADNAVVNAADVERLFSLFARSTPDARKEILIFAESAEKLSASTTGILTND